MCRTSPTSTTTSSSGPTSRGAASPRWRTSSRRGGGRPWTGSTCSDPTTPRTPRGYIADMVALVADLLARGMAYETSDGVYLDVSQVPGTGSWPGRASTRYGPEPGSRSNDEKRSPLDFAVWKKAKEGEPRGTRRGGPDGPGWHTECVVMSLDLLGDGFDLHGGGRDLAFPHHENERAQAVAEGRPSPGTGCTTAGSRSRATKMSKSLGNFTSLTDLLTRVTAAPTALLVLRAHYRSPDRGDAGDRGGRREGARTARCVGPALRSPATCSAQRAWLCGRGRGRRTDIDPGALAAFRDRMDDDMDTPGALAGDLRARDGAPTPRRTPGTRPRRSAWPTRPPCSWLRSGVSLRDEPPRSTRRRPAGGRARRGPGGQGLRPGRRVAGRAGRPGLDGRGHPDRHRHPPLA